MARNLAKAGKFQKDSVGVTAVKGFTTAANAMGNYRRITSVTQQAGPHIKRGIERWPQLCRMRQQRAELAVLFREDAVVAFDS